METVSNVQFVYCYVVRRIVGISPYACYTKFDMDESGKLVTGGKVQQPETVVEVYANEIQALQRSQALADELAKSVWTCKTSVTKHLAVTADAGITVSLIDALNTYNMHHSCDTE